MMRLLLRRSQLAVVLAALLALVALPFTWTGGAPWHGIAPTLSYAGGSPDETLNPQPYPRRMVTVIGHTSEEAAQLAKQDSRLDRRSGLNGLVRSDWVLLWRLNLTSLLRF